MIHQGRRATSYSVENTRSYTNRLVEALSHLHGPGGVPVSLDKFLAGVQVLFQATGVLWWEYRLRDRLLKLQAVSGEFEPGWENFTDEENQGLAGLVFSSGESQVLEGEAIKAGLPESIADHPDVETAVAIRVDSGDRPLGVLVVLFGGRATLAMQQMETMVLLGRALGRAVESRILQDELAEQFRRLLLLHDLSSILQSKRPLSMRLDKLVETLSQAFGARYGHILLAGEDDEQVGLFLTVRASHGAALSTYSDIRLSPGEGIAGTVFQTGQPLLVEDVSQNPDFVASRSDVQSEMAVPISAEGEVIGVLNLESDRLAAFRNEDLRLASIVAAQAGVTLKHALALEDAVARMRELELLNRVTRAIATTEDLGDLLNTIVEEVHGAMQTTVVGILLIEENGLDMRVHAAAGGNQDVLTELKMRVGKGVTGIAAESGVTQYVPDVTRDNRYVPVDPTIRSELAVPLINKGRVIGVLNLESDRTNAFSDEDLRVADILAAQISQILVKALLYEELALMAVTDGLTGLFNHRQFFVRLEAEFKRAVRYSYPLSLIMLDIDFFKKYNDTFGHLRGDEVLRRIAELITSTMRETDILARYGGEEFAVILPLCHESTAREVAERLRLRVEEADLGGGDEPLTISLGICTAPQHAETHEELVRRADDAMYISKNQGRNQCTVWSPDLAAE